MVGEIMRECNNYFEDAGGPHSGQWQVEGQVLVSVDGVVLHAGWVAIHGSAHHDGVWRVDDGVLEGCQDLPDEGFYGDVWELYPPYALLKLAQDVAAFDRARPLQPVQSESFGEYSHTFVSGSHGLLTWQEAFAGRLRPFRRMFTEVQA